MVKLNKYLILIEFLLFNIVGQSIIQCAARIQTEQSATNLDLELIEAATYGNKEQVKQLIEAGANVNAVDKDGWTALMGAAINGYNEMIELLIKAKANVNTANKNGLTALIWAAYYGHKEVVELLLCAGADISNKNIDEQNAIKIAQRNNKQEIVKMLENEPSRRVEVVKKWIKDKFAKEITESTSSLLIPDIANIIADYVSPEYKDIPLEYRLAN